MFQGEVLSLEQHKQLLQELMSKWISHWYAEKQSVADEKSNHLYGLD